MSSEFVAIHVRQVGKVYTTFDAPFQRFLHLMTGGRHGRHKDHVALQDISMTVRRGETVGIVGRNGSGKSTLLSIICGTLAATSGEVEVNGRLAALLELGAGLNPELTGRENIPLAAQIYGLSEDAVRERLDDIIAFADIADYIDQPVKTYSSGMFTRLAFAVIAHVDADVLVIDEALAVGDAYFVQKCMRFLRGFCESGGTLLFVSHDMGSVTALCDRAVWLSAGAVRMDGSPKEIANGYLADLYEMPTDSAATRAEVGAGKALASAPDPRQALLASSNLRNDLRILSYDFDGNFGAGGAKIVDVEFRDEHGEAISWLLGGEIVRLTIRANAMKSMHGAIIGFVVKDRTGQPLFGDNTHLTYLDTPVDVANDSCVEALFEFRMPVMPKGTYAVSVAISEGTQASHLVHDWIHDAVVFESVSTSVAKGLIGIPMENIKLESSVDRNP
ncbi:MAG: ABC transporter ATP-binding protein [Proteobacteria bacterium]|nr:ABC transporter ATP-binding protein [Pseudomonadota bacterium]MBS0216718.1 ABC transporter ATP-binding protein [Pseudomonadota bacterium]